MLAASDLLAQTLQLIDTSAGRLKIKPLCEADYALPKTFGSVPRSGVRVNALADLLAPELRAQGWKNAVFRVVDMQATEISVAFRLHSTESMHDWLERIKNSRKMLDGLADAGFDVRPDMEEFLANAR